MCWALSMGLVNKKLTKNIRNETSSYSGTWKHGTKFCRLILSHYENARRKAD